jgi:hypothetical protein
MPFYILVDMVVNCSEDIQKKGYSENVVFGQFYEVMYTWTQYRKLLWMR